MVAKTECCGWDVWGELSGIGSDSRRDATLEWAVKLDDRTARKPDPVRDESARTTRDAHEDR
jgi:hypothetical protein